MDDAHAGSTDTHDLVHAGAHDGQVDSLGTAYYCQIISFDYVQSAGEKRPLMARIGLNVAGFTEEYPVLLGEMLSALSHPGLHATVALLNLSPHVPIHWSDRMLECLKHWANHDWNGRAK